MKYSTAAAVAGCVLVASAIYGCSAQSGSSGAAASSGVAAASSGNACKVDAARICEQAKDKPVISSETGKTEDARMREQNSFRTAAETVHFQTPGGTTIEVECRINAEHSSVVYAIWLPGAKLTDPDIVYLRGKGLCAAN